MEMVSPAASSGRTISPYAIDGNELPIGGNPFIGLVPTTPAPFTLGINLGLDMSQWTDLRPDAIFGAAMGGSFCTN